MASLGVRSRQSLAAAAAVLLLTALAVAPSRAWAEGASAPDRLEAHAQALRLSVAQLRALNLLRLDAQAAEAPLEAEQRVLELRLRRAQLASPGAAAADASLSRLDQLSAQVARERRDVERRAYAILSSAQRDQALRFELETATAPPTAAGAPTAPLGVEAKLLEFETSEAIADRLIKWAQIFAVVVGVPLAILAATLALLGVTSLAEFRKRVQEAGDAIKSEMGGASSAIAAQVKAARAGIDAQMTEAAALQTELGALRQRFGELSALEKNVRQISDQMNRIEQFIGFEKSKALTPELQARLEAVAARYRDWLIGVGGDPGEPVSVLISDDKHYVNAHYEMPNRLVIGEVLAVDDDVLLREYTHHVLSEARTEGDRLAFTAIQSGIADYLPCSFNGDPAFGAKSAPAFNKHLKEEYFKDGYVRNMVNRDKIVKPVFAGAPQQEGQAWGGAFWELRDLVGQDAADRLILRAWTGANKIADTLVAYKAFARGLVALIAEAQPAKAAKADAIFHRRGLDLAAPGPRKSS